MKKLYIILFAGLIVQGCARIPAESVQLSDAVMKEGARMHNININMINVLFNEKKKQVSEFIEIEYTPEIIKNFSAQVKPEDVSIANLPQILQAIIPEITERRDAMIQALEEQRIKLINQLNVEYQVYSDASVAIHDLLSSAAQVDAERASLNDRILQLSGNKIDLNKVEHSVDEFISKAGSTGTIDQAITELNNTINEIINTKK